MNSAHSTTEQIMSNSEQPALIEKLQQGCELLGLDVKIQSLEQLVEHIRLMQHWNRRLNLTAITSADEMVVQHILDSLVVHSFIHGDRILDIGTGGGFPGIPLAVLFPEKRVTLLDSRGKRIEFLRHVGSRLKLKNIALANCRVEDFIDADGLDTLVCRAFSSLADMLKWTKRLQSAGTRLIAMKGKHPAEELEQLQSIDTSLMKISVEQIKVPFLSGERHVVIIDF